MGKSSDSEWPRGVGRRLLLGFGVLFFFFPLGALVLARTSDLSVKPSEKEETPAFSRRTPTPGDDEDVKILLAQSRDHLAREDAANALVPLARAVSLAPENAEVHNNLCVAYGILKQRRAAVGECAEALRLRPSFRLAENNMKWVSSLPSAGNPSGNDGK